MPVPTPPVSDRPLFPRLTREQVDAARTSVWYPTFQRWTIPTSIVDLEQIEEEQEFRRWFDADSIFMPQGSEGKGAPSVEGPDEPVAGPSRSPRIHAPRTILNAQGPSRSATQSAGGDSEDDTSDEDENETEPPVYRLPRLNESIRQAVRLYGGTVFPKLNWTAPRDAAFMLPSTIPGPLACHTPADVYLLLKSSDFVPHSLDPDQAYEDCNFPTDHPADPLKVELVLRRYEQIDPGREFRCFVRDNILIGISQRDVNFYQHLQKKKFQGRIVENVRAFWEDRVRGKYGGSDDYIFDVHLDASMTECTIIDFAPYRQSTDALLFTYEELLDILNVAYLPPPPTAYEDDHTALSRPRLPILRVIDSAGHPTAARAAPTFGTSMMPLDLLQLSEGRSLDNFTQELVRAVQDGMH